MKKTLTILFILNLTLFNINYIISLDQGINTIDEKNKGNWYEKLNWWRKSKPKYESLAKLINAIKINKKDIEDKHKKIVSKFESLINNLNIDINLFVKKIETKISELDKLIETEYLENESDQLNSTNNLKNTLQKLKLDFQALILIKKNLDQSISENLTNQLQEAENYEENALNSFEKIEHVLDDKKARTLYETIENANDNILVIKNYITGPFQNYINESEIKLNQLETNIEKIVKDLEAKDIYLRELTPEEIKKKEEQELLKKEQENQAKEKQKKVEAPKSQSWYQAIINFFKNLIYIFMYFFKSKKST